MRFGMLLLLLAGLASCAAEEGPGSSEGIGKAAAIEAARREVQTRESWAARAVYSATWVDGGWVVFAARKADRGSDPDDPYLNNEPNVLVTVDARGKVTSYAWGRDY